MSNARKIAVVIPKYGLLGGARKFAYELTERLSSNEKNGQNHHKKENGTT